MADKTPAQIKAEEEARKKQHEEEQKKSRGGGTTPGAMGTYGASHSVPVEPVRQEDHAFTHDEVKGLAGDIQRGEIARIELDEEGTPTGHAFRGLPKKDQIVAPVMGTPAVQFDELVTPSGAPITKHMNPEPVLWDAGMLARNPPPEMSEHQKKHIQQGGGVINQPVAS